MFPQSIRSTNILYTYMQKSIGLDTSDAECDRVALALTPANYSREIFGTNQTTVVGLTEALYAVTDGTHIQYFNHYDSARSVVVPNAWPIPIDIRFGVASVTYYKDSPERDALGNPSTTMLGCRCLDLTEGRGISIQCALALEDISTYGDYITVEDDLTFNVPFQKRSTSKYMSCVGAEISVQSVRWPSTRFTRAFVDESDLDDTCQSRRTCNIVDATIWVSPLCTSSSTSISPVCTTVFQDAACYPYCMAARRSGSGASDVILYNAPDWKERVHLMDRDCGVETHLVDPVSDVRSGDAKYLNNLEGFKETDPRVAVETRLDTDVLNGSVRIINWDSNLGCVDSSITARSIVGVDAHDGYRKSRAFRSLLMPGQPFAFAGDTTLTGVRASDGEYFVKVDRLYGNEVYFVCSSIVKPFACGRWIHTSTKNHASPCYHNIGSRSKTLMICFSACFLCLSTPV